MSSITWTQYGIFMCAATLLYYIVVVLIYYRNRLPAVYQPAGFDQQGLAGSRKATNGNEFVPTLENSFIEKKVVSVEVFEAASPGLDFQAAANNNYNGNDGENTTEASRLLNETEFELSPDLLQFIAGENSGVNGGKIEQEITPYPAGEIPRSGDDPVTNTHSATVEAIAFAMKEHQPVPASDIATTALFQHGDVLAMQEGTLSNMSSKENTPELHLTTDTRVQQADPISGTEAHTNGAQTVPQKEKDSILHLLQRQKTTNK